MQNQQAGEETLDDGSFWVVASSKQNPQLDTLGTLLINISRLGCLCSSKGGLFQEVLGCCLVE
jgi:hypothetical protein